MILNEDNLVPVYIGTLSPDSKIMRNLLVHCLPADVRRVLFRALEYDDTKPSLVVQLITCYLVGGSKPYGVSKPFSVSSLGKKQMFELIYNWETGSATICSSLQWEYSSNRRYLEKISSATQELESRRHINWRFSHTDCLFEDKYSHLLPARRVWQDIYPPVDWRKPHYISYPFDNGWLEDSDTSESGSGEEESEQEESEQEESEEELEEESDKAGPRGDEIEPCKLD